MEEIEVSHLVQRDYYLRSNGPVNFDPSTSQPTLNPMKVVFLHLLKKVTTRNIPLINMDYNLIGDMKETNSNVYIFIICNIP